MEINLNLVSPEKKEKIRKKNQIIFAIRIELFFTILLAVFLFIILSFNYILNLNLSSVLGAEERSINSGRYDKIKEFDKNFNQVNQNLSDIISIKNSQLYWSKLFLKLNDVIFPGIGIDSISSSDYSISLRGVSDTRDNLILLKDKLAGEKCFSDVDLPLADLVGKDNITFQIDFIIDKNCLKRQ